MMRWRIDIEYDGTPFAGWQVQPEQRTVQGCLTEAARQFLGEAVGVEGAGRTDAGVHAVQQVAAFTTSVERPLSSIVPGLNAHLPDEIAVVHASVADQDFHPRHSPHTKCYRYRWLDRGVRSPLRRSRVWCVRDSLDVQAMASAVDAMRGTHDFSSFRAVGCSSKHPVRTIEGASVTRVGEEVHLELLGTGFLRHMVRIVAGHLYEIGRGSRAPEWLAQVRDHKQRDPAARTAQPGGLTLQWIRYSDPSAGKLELL